MKRIFTACLLCALLALSSCAAKDGTVTGNTPSATVALPEGGLEAFLGLGDPTVLAQAEYDLDGDGKTEHVELRDASASGTTILILFASSDAATRWLSIYYTTGTDFTGRFALWADESGFFLRAERKTDTGTRADDYPVLLADGTLCIVCGGELVRLNTAGAQTTGQ